MVDREFNRELSNYLSARKRPRLGEQFISAIREKTKSHSKDKIVEGKEERVFTGSTIEVIEEETEGVFNRILKSLGFSKAKKEDVGEVIDLTTSQQGDEPQSDDSEFAAEENEFDEEVKGASFFDRVRRWLGGKKDEIKGEPMPESEFKRVIEELELEEEKLEEQEEELKKRKNSILKEILGKFVGHIDFKESMPDKEELKEMAKITLSVIKRLKKRELDDFKNSYEFTRFKEILKDNNLLKQK